MQRIFLLIFILAVGCAEQKENETEVKLVVWECFKEEHLVFLDLARQFEELYQKQTGKKLTIEVRRVPFDDFETNLKLAALGGKTPDIACFDALKVLEFAYHKVLIPLDTLPNFETSIEAKSKQYMRGAFDTNIVEIQGEKHLYGLPLQTTCLALFWNRRMFREQSEELKKRGLDPKAPPKTWDELIQYAQVLTIPEKQQYGFAMLNKLWFTLPFFGCYNVSYIDTDANGHKTCILGDPLSTAALQLKVDLYRKHQVEAGAWKQGAINTEIGFKDQKYAMILTGPWNVKKYRNAGIDLGIGKIPKISKQEAVRVGLIAKDASDAEYHQNIKSATNVGGNNIAIFRTCHFPQIAYQFIDFVSSKEAQLYWCRKLNQIPVNKKASEELRQDSSTDSDIKVFMEQALYSTAPPRIPRYGYLETDIVNPEMELALKGKKTAQKALQDAARKANDRILKYLNEEN